ncbi:MAG: IS481 family transposase [Alphaproteobacteria bacterium]|nr:MAG: IS481 family transposase [Alphaproteobacteria bacterium]
MTDDPQRQAVALFRYGLIADLLHLEPGSAEIAVRLREIASRNHDIPGSARTRVAVDTLRTWLRAYRSRGFDALLPKLRADRGKPRRIPDDIAERLIAIKENNPSLSVRRIIGLLHEERGTEVRLPRSTVHRLLQRAGLMVRQSDAPTGVDRRRFAFQFAGQLWMSDVMHGPAVHDGRRKRKTYLIAFIDDATRVIPYAAFAFAESTAAFLPVFKDALLRRGLPERLYVDNGANYRSNHFALICARLGIALIHARPFQPQGKGKIERWFRTLRAALISQLGEDDLTSIDALNRRLWAFIEGDYHHTPHAGLDGRTPLDAWATLGDGVRYVDARIDLDDLFLAEAKRRVASDRTVSLDGRLYEVDALLVGATVTLRYDPQAPPSRPINIVHDGKPAGQATPLDAYANTRVRRNRPSGGIVTDDPAPQPATSPISMRNLDSGER